MMSPEQKWLLILGTLMGLLSVLAGAFGAHALKHKLGHEMVAVFEIGARYQMYHAFAIGLAVWISTMIPGILPLLSGWTFFAGSIIFSGSLYALSLSGIRMIGMITPIGGVLLALGWLFLMVAVFKSL